MGKECIDELIKMHRQEGGTAHKKAGQKGGKKVEEVVPESYLETVNSTLRRC